MLIDCRVVDIKVLFRYVGMIYVIFFNVFFKVFLEGVEFLIIEDGF